MATAAASLPGKPALATTNTGLLTVGVMAAMVMQILDTTIANVALPHMQTSLGATMDTVTWVLTSYIVASAIALPITGWLSDRYGSRNLFLVAVGGFVVASMLCGTAVNLEEMVLFRVFQGIFAAFIAPLSQTVMLDINPPERQGKAMAIWGMGVMVGPIMGPVIGGWLTENYNWRWVFYVNVPVGILTFGLLWWLLPSKQKRTRSFDMLGFSMLAIGLASFQLMLDRGQQEDWFQSWEIMIEAGIAMAAFWIFVVHMATGRKPLFDRHMLANRNLLTGLFFMFLVGITAMAPMALLPPMLQQLFGYSVIDTGMVLAPRGVGVLITMWLGGQLIGKVDPRYLIGTGVCISAYSMWLMTHWSLEMDWHSVITSGFLQGIGMGLVFMPLNSMAFATLSSAYRTDGASLLNLTRSVGSSAGISMVTTLLSRNSQISHADISSNLTALSLPAINPEWAGALGSGGGTIMAMANAEITRQALMIAYLDDFYLMAGVTMLTLPLVFILKRPKPGVKLEVVHSE